MSKEKTYTIITPNPYFNGKRAGVSFKKGTGKTKDRSVAQELVNVWRYACEELDEETADGKPTLTHPAAKAAPLSRGEEKSKKQEEVARPSPDSTNKVLREYMEAHEVPFESDDNKADLNEKIDDWRQDTNPRRRRIK